MKSNKGLTLIGVLVVFAVIGLILVAVMPHILSPGLALMLIKIFVFIVLVITFGTVAIMAITVLCPSKTRELFGKVSQTITIRSKQVWNIVIYVLFRGSGTK